jgi:hypothetical protein
VADILIDNQTAPTTPASGKSVLWNDSSTKSFVHTDDTGRHTGSLSRNDATASLSISAADTYLTNSGLLVPSFGMKAGMLFRWFITATKTAAGTAAAIYTVRIGTGQSVSDTSRLALTATTAQTAAISSGIILVVVHVRSVRLGRDRRRRRGDGEQPRLGLGHHGHQLDLRQHGPRRQLRRPVDQQRHGRRVDDRDRLG